MLIKNLWSSASGNTGKVSLAPSSRQAYRVVRKPTAEHRGSPPAHGPLNQHKPSVGPCIPHSGPANHSNHMWLCFTFLRDTRLCRLPGGLDGKESACNAEGLGSIPGWGRSPGEGHGNPLQYSCLENPHGPRSLEGYSPRGHTGLDTTEHIYCFP